MPPLFSLSKECARTLFPKNFSEKQLLQRNQGPPPLSRCENEKLPLFLFHQESASFLFRERLKPSLLNDLLSFFMVTLPNQRRGSCAFPSPLEELVPPPPLLRMSSTFSPFECGRGGELFFEKKTLLFFCNALFFNDNILCFSPNARLF